MVTNEHVEQFARDGVVLLRGVIGPEWIASLRSGIEENLARPTVRGRLWNRDASGTATFYDSQAWQDIAPYREFVLRSPMAELAGSVMGVAAVNFFFDAIFVREAGAQFRTPFHQDEPYWSVSGFDCASSWMPLAPVAKKSALEFVRGSHRWDKRYQQQNFGALTGDTRDQIDYSTTQEQGSDLVPFPDVDGNRDDFDLVSWDMEPGDVALFNARTIHGGSGNLDPDRELQVFNTQWLGDDVRVCFRSEGMDPDHSQEITASGLKPGDRMGGDLYPQVWRRS